MKLSKTLIITKYDEQNELVWFESEDGKVTGSAYKKNGCGETQYDVTEVIKLNGSEPLKKYNYSMHQIGTNVGEFEITGTVETIWEDGVFTVEVFGYDFWIEPDEFPHKVKPGDWFQMKITNLTLYI